MVVCSTSFFAFYFFRRASLLTTQKQVGMHNSSHHSCTVLYLHVLSLITALTTHSPPQVKLEESMREEHRGGSRGTRHWSFSRGSLFWRQETSYCIYNTSRENIDNFFLRFRYIFTQYGVFRICDHSFETATLYISPLLTVNKRNIHFWSHHLIIRVVMPAYKHY